FTQKNFGLLQLLLCCKSFTRKTQSDRPRYSTKANNPIIPTESMHIIFQSSRFFVSSTTKVINDKPLAYLSTI
ncbi:MAG TPA: hypothetical protein VE574_04930, partial [Nitrososphaeraceae archaeon]|nr:hypothetical protein [Nitrososphaeraceae archaeon]